MRKLFVVLAILGTTSVPAASQTAPVPDQSQPAKAQMVKKRVCQMSEEDPSSRLGNRRICKTVEVPAPSATGSSDNSATRSKPERG